MPGWWASLLLKGSFLEHPPTRVGDAFMRSYVVSLQPMRCGIITVERCSQSLGECGEELNPCRERGLGAKAPGESPPC